MWIILRFLPGEIFKVIQKRLQYLDNKIEDPENRSQCFRIIPITKESEGKDMIEFVTVMIIKVAVGNTVHHK